MIRSLRSQSAAAASLLTVALLAAGCAVNPTSTTPAGNSDASLRASLVVPDVVPSVVGDTLVATHPNGVLLDFGRDVDDGYWWFDVRNLGGLWDVEIANDGTLLANRLVAPPDDDDGNNGGFTLADVPQPILDVLFSLHPGGTVLDIDRDSDGGYWDFYVRVDGVIWDVEIADDGTVLENDIDDD